MQSLRRVIQCERSQIFKRISEEKINFLEFVFQSLNLQVKNSSVNKIQVKELCKKFSLSINETKENLEIYLQDKLIGEVKLIDFYLFKSDASLDARLEFEYKSIFNINTYVKE